MDGFSSIRRTAKQATGTSSLEAVIAALNPPEIRDDAVTSTEVAEALGISQNTALRQLQKAVQDGKMKRVRTRRMFSSRPLTVDGYIAVEESEVG